MHRNAEMVTAARMQRSLERGVLEASLSMPCVHDGVGHQAQARIAVIDDVMRGVEREESWPRFITVLRIPQVREHVLEGENAAWMHTFALALLGRVAAGVSLVAQPSTELSVTLAVEAARDAAAHWTTALELLAEDDAVLLTDPPRGATRSASR